MYIYILMNLLDSSIGLSGYNCVYIKLDVTNMPSKGVESINKQIQQTSRHNGLENS